VHYLEKSFSRSWFGDNLQQHRKWGRPQVGENQHTRETTGSSFYGVAFSDAQDRNVNHKNAVNWGIDEDPLLQTGIPSLVRTAVRVKRESDENFIAWVNIETDVAGFSLRRLQSGLLGPEFKDDPVIFNPMLRPVGGESIDAANPGDLDLESLVSVTLERPTFQTADEIERTERQAGVELTTLFGNIPGNIPTSDGGKKSSSDSWYVELWNMESSGDKWVEKASAHTKLDKDRFAHTPSTPLSLLVLITYSQ